MNRLYLIFATVLLLLGCSRSDAEIAIDSDSLYSPKFYAKLGGDDARTYLDENWQQRWVKQDSISVFTSTANQKYKFDGETGDNSGTFSVAASNQAGSNAALSVDANFAVYPYNESTTITPDGTISLTIPTEQRYAKNSFDAGANQMVAVTSSRSDTDLRFRNLCGYLRLRLYGEDVTVREIYLHSNSGERLSGSAKVYTLSEGGFAMAMDESANWHIRLYCEEGVKIGETAAQATDFWFVVPPVLFEVGFQISVYDNQGCYFWHPTWNRFNIDRNVVESMTPIEVKPNGVLLDKYEYYVGTEGGIVEVEAQMPGTLSVEIPEEYKSWVSYIEPTRALHSETVRFKIAPSEQERSCYVNIFSTVDGNQYVTGVTIKQTDSIVVSEKEVNVNPWGAWFSIGIRDGIDYAITIPEGVDWIHADENQDPNSNWRGYYVDYNESYESRTAELVVTDTSNNNFEIVTVTQGPRNEVEVDRGTYYVGTEGGTIDIEARLTGTLSVEVPEEYQDWISYVEPTRAIHSETVQLNIAPTEAGKEREGNVILKSENADGSINNRWITIRQTDTIVVGEKEIMIDEWGGTFSIGIRDGLDYAITIPEGVDWIHADENQDPNSYWRNYQVDNNQTYETRTAEIVVTNRRNNKFEIVKVTQAPSNDIKTEENTYYIDTEGGLINIAAQMVGTLSVEIPEEYQEWISYVEPTRAMHSETVQLNIAPTEVGKERDGSIIISSTNINGSTRSRRIYIRQTDSIVISEKEVYVSPWNSWFSIGIREGIDYTITIPEGVDWIHASENQDPNSNWREYYADYNESYESRTAELVVTNTSNNKSEIITVTQGPRNEVEVDRGTYYVGTEGGTIDIEARLTGTLSVEVPEEYQDWISYVEPTRAIHSETVQLNIAPTEAGKEREGNIIIHSTNVDGSKNGCWISIRQTDAIVIGEKEIMIGEWGGSFSIGIREGLDYAITIPEGVDWIHADENQDPNSYWRNYQVDNNQTYESRTAEIVVTNRRNNKFEIVKVTQAPSNDIKTEENTYYIDTEGGLITFEAKMVGTLSVEIPEECKSWISYIEPTRAMHSETIQLEIAPLEAGKERNGDVIIYSENINGSKNGCWISIRQTDTIVINEKEYLMPDWGGWFSIGVRDDLDYTITIPEGVDWIHAGENQDPNSNWRGYYVDYNESYESRTAEIVVTNNRNNKFEIVKVTQAPRNEIEIEKDWYYVDTEGASLELEVKTMGVLSVEVPEEYQDWISYVEPTRAMHSTTVQLNIAPLEAGKEREGNIILNSENIDGSINSRWIHIKQTDVIVISEKEFEIDEWGGGFSLGIREDIDYTITIPEKVTWIHAYENQDPTSRWVYYYVDNNQTYETRTAEIVVTNKKNKKSETVTVTQAQRDVIVVAQNRYYINSKGGNIEIEVSNNVDFDVEISADWITQVQTRALNQQTLVFAVATNTALVAREGTIKFISKDGSITQTIKINQAKGSAFGPSVDDWEDDDEDHGGPAE